MKRNSMFAVLAVLTMSACATMSSEKGRYSVNGITLDPIQAAAVTGRVNMEQDALKTCAEMQKDAAAKNIIFDPATCLRSLNGGGYYNNNGYAPTPYNYWNGVMGDRQFFFGNVSGFRGQAMSAVQTVYDAPNGSGEYATRQDLQRVDARVDQSMQYHRNTKAILKSMAKQSQ